LEHDYMIIVQSLFFDWADESAGIKYPGGQVVPCKIEPQPGWIHTCGRRMFRAVVSTRFLGRGIHMLPLEQYHSGQQDRPSTAFGVSRLACRQYFKSVDSHAMQYPNAVPKQSMAIAEHAGDTFAQHSGWGTAKCQTIMRKPSHPATIGPCLWPCDLCAISTRATLHCLIGCAIGEVTGLAIRVYYGLSPVTTMLLATVLAYINGFSPAASAIIRKQRLTLVQALHAI